MTQIKKLMMTLCLKIYHHTHNCLPPKYPSSIGKVSIHFIGAAAFAFECSEYFFAIHFAMLMIIIFIIIIYFTTTIS
jgi:hypothetical protein